MVKPSFGIFDHIEDIPGTSTPQLLKDRLDLIRMADAAGFAGFHLAEHHGSDLCMAPNQEVFLAAASQITKNIRLGPLVKLLPLASPGADHRGHGRARQPDQRSARLRRGPRRRAHRALLVRQQLARFEGSLRRRAGHHLRRIRHGRDQQRELEVLRISDDPAVDQTRPEPDPVLVPGEPDHRRSTWHEPDVAGTDRPGRSRPLRRDMERAPRRHPSRRWARFSAARRLHDDAGNQPDGERVARRRSAHDEWTDATDPQRAQVRPSRFERRGVRCGSRTAAQHHVPHGSCNSVRRRHCRTDQGPLRGGPRVRLDRLHRAATSRGRHDTRRGQAHDGPVLQRGEAGARGRS